MKKIKLKFFTIILATTSLMAQQYPQPLVSAIKEKDLKTDMYQLAADEFWGARGRNLR